MRIAIFDDNDKDRALLCTIIHDWCQNVLPSATTVHQFDATRGLENALQDRHFYDLYFLDIMTSQAHDAGFRLAEEIRQKDIRAIIVFTTNSTEYMSSAFEISAYRYLMKPVSSEKVFEILKKSYELHISQKKKIGEFQWKNEKLIIAYSDILYIESMVLYHKARIYLTNGTSKDVSIAGTTFSAFAQTRLPEDFFQCHRGFIINMSHITGYGKDYVILCDSINIPLGRNRKEDFINYLLTYHKGLL